MRYYFIVSMFLQSSLNQLVPKKVRNLRHLFYAWRGAVKYHHPSEELFVLGITGTSGKSSTTYFLRQMLEEIGYTVGSLSTIDFYVAGENKLNDQKMTMLGKMQIQKYLREMVTAGCDIAIVETTSEGRLQHRHRFSNYDTMMLTNLYPEHIDSHGSFENYKQAKKDIFEYVSTCKRKNFQKLERDKLQALFSGDIPKGAIVNSDHEYAQEFFYKDFERKFVFGVQTKKFTEVKETFFAENIRSDKKGLSFDVQGHHFFAPLFGEHNVSNICGAIAFLRSWNIDWSVVEQVVSHLKGPEGRLEFIPEAKQKGFDVIVDYAFEPVAMQKLYEVVQLLSPKRVIHVFGGTGGGRDIARRFTVGEFVGKNADVCIVTDEDPYDDNPQTIIDDVASAALKAGHKEGKTLFKILDRREAIEKAMQMAEPGDLILVTGKGSEQGMVVKGKIISWDDRKEVRAALAKREM